MNHEMVLNEKAKFYTRYLWNKELDIPVKINKRLKSTLGQCSIKVIDIAKFVTEDEIMTDDTLLHELCHWYCRQAGEDYKDHSRFFEDELERIGASSTETTEFVDGELKFLYKYGCYNCDSCRNRLETKDYLEEPAQGIAGRSIKKYFCCNTSMRFSGRKLVPEKFIPNEKLKAINDAYKIKYSTKGECN